MARRFLVTSFAPDPNDDFVNAGQRLFIARVQGVIVQAAPKGFAILGGIAATQFIGRGDRFGENHSHFGFTRGHDGGTSLAEGGRVTQMGAAGKHSQLRIEEARFDDDFGGIFDIGAQDEAAGGLDTCLYESPRPEHIAIKGGMA